MFCSIISGKTPSIKIFEDNDFVAILDIRPANKGHIILLPKKHVTFISEMKDSEVSEFFIIAKELALNTVNKVGAKGFNIIYSAGQQAGQQTPHAFLHIIPRFDNDKVQINWEPIQLTQEDFVKLHQDLSYNRSIKVEEKREVIKQEPKKSSPKLKALKEGRRTNGQDNNRKAFQAR